MQINKISISDCHPAIKPKEYKRALDALEGNFNQFFKTPQRSDGYYEKIASLISKIRCKDSSDRDHIVEYNLSVTECLYENKIIGLGELERLGYLPILIDKLTEQQIFNLNPYELSRLPEIYTYEEIKNISKEEEDIKYLLKSIQLGFDELKENKKNIIHLLKEKNLYDYFNSKIGIENLNIDNFEKYDAIYKLIESGNLQKVCDSIKYGLLTFNFDTAQIEALKSLAESNKLDKAVKEIGGSNLYTTPAEKLLSFLP